MPTKTEIYNQSGIYFITFTCLQWIPLIDMTNAYYAVYKWFDYLKQQGHFIIGFVIMPNHVHAIIAFINKGKTINSIISNGKRFMAYEIIDNLKKQNNVTVLNQLAEARTDSEKASKKLHKVFETSFDWKWCNSDKLIEQKLAYIHQNPCKGKWNLANSTIEYEHSSAKYYLTDLQGKYCVTDYREIEKINLHGLDEL